MDGSSHPDSPKATEKGVVSRVESKDTQVRVNDAPPMPGSVTTVTHSGTKRPHEPDTHSESGEKRQNVTSDDEGDLDLEALMAHLQQHTEQHSEQRTNRSIEDVSASSDDKSSGTPSEPNVQLKQADTSTATPDNPTSSHGSSPPESEDNYGDRELEEGPATETELSIAAQLRGALSSLQELNTNDSDDIDLDEITQLLHSAQERTMTEAQGESSEHSETSHAPFDEPKSHDQTTGPRAESSDQQSASVSASNESAPPNSGTSDKDTAGNKREELMLRMPPPPAHLKALPPMPPPPPAFTSPIASFTASEISKNRDRISTLISEPSRLRSSGNSSQLRLASAPNTQDSISRAANPNKPATENMSKFPEPKFSEVPTVSDDYGSMLANEVDGIIVESKTSSRGANGPPNLVSNISEHSFSMPPDNASLLSHAALHLNTNKAILETRKRSILLLDSLACQILDTLSFSHYQDTLSTVMQPESDRGMAYRILLDAFEDLKRIYLKWETPSSRNQPEPKVAEVRPFLPYNVPGIEATRDNFVTIQRVNLATFVAAVFGSIEIGFHELNDWFIKVFVPENGRLLKQQCNIYLDLKTQAYISALETTDDTKAQQEALEHLFPANLETQIQAMLGDRISLAPTEKDFVAKCNRRKENIKSEDPKSLPMKYHWVPFLRDISEYVSRNHYTLLPQRRHSIVPTEIEAHPLPTSTSSVRQYVGTRRQAPAAPSRATSVPAESATPTKPANGETGQSQSPGAASEQSNIHPEQIASRNTESAGNNPTIVEVAAAEPSNDIGQYKNRDLKLEPIDGNPSENAGDSTHAPTDAEPVSHSGPTAAPRVNSPIIPNPAPTNTTDSNDRSSTALRSHPSVPIEGHPLFPPLPKQVLPRPLPSSTPVEPVDRERTRRPGPRNQPIPDLSVNPDSSNTLAVYEAARASAEGTDLVRPKVSLYTTRRTWTKEEEEALLKGMDKVQGPYWAQILELYGPGGKINEVLKDRTQVQLKDKARNLKMFFVRLGLPIPAVFQYVTGDYETRKSSSKRVRDKKQLKAAGSMAANPTLPARYPVNTSQAQAISNLSPSGGNGVHQTVSHNASQGVQSGMPTTVYGNLPHVSTNPPITMPSMSGSLPNSQLVGRSLSSNIQGPSTASVSTTGSSGNSVNTIPSNVSPGEELRQGTTPNTSTAGEPSTRGFTDGDHQHASSPRKLSTSSVSNTDHSVQATTLLSTTSTSANHSVTSKDSGSLNADKNNSSSSPEHRENELRSGLTATTTDSGPTLQPQSILSNSLSQTLGKNDAVHNIPSNLEPSDALSSRTAADAGESITAVESNVVKTPNLSQSIEPPRQESAALDSHEEPGEKEDDGQKEEEDDDDDDELSNLLDRVGRYVENN